MFAFLEQLRKLGSVLGDALTNNRPTSVPMAQTRSIRWKPLRRNALTLGATSKSQTNDLSAISS